MRLIGLPPIVFPDSRMLILGTFPSVQSLEKKEYYGNRINGFWKILCGALAAATVPEDYEDKKLLLRKYRIALWDVFGSCERQGFEDQAIKNSYVNPIPEFLEKHSGIKKVLVESRTAERIWVRQIQKYTAIPGVYVPSPSTLARMPLAQKMQCWKRELI